MSDDTPLEPTEVRNVEFYGDTITGALVQIESEPQIYVPLRPICEYLGLSWNGQRERVMRDEVLSEAVRFIRVTRANSSGGNPNLLALPLELLPGFLFGVTTSRIKAELRERIILYRRECYRRLWDTFKGEILQFAAIVPVTQPSGAALAFELANAVANLAREQMDLEARMNNAAAWAKNTTHAIQTLDARVNALEERLPPNATISNAQAGEIALRVKTVANALEQRGQVNGYQRVYGELYRRFEIGSYKSLAQSRYDEALAWLRAWYDEINAE
jgi:P22_AR N-terminal domain/ORF6C domain